jgi:hypothetical protein
MNEGGESSCEQRRDAASVLLGHNQIGIILDLYFHVTATMQQEAARALESCLAVGQAGRSYRRPDHHVRARSSVGQSSGLITGWHQMDAGL